MGIIQLQPQSDQLICQLSGAQAFPGEAFRLGYPETLGDVSAPVKGHSLTWTWTGLRGGALRCEGEGRDELRFELLLVPGEDRVSVRFELTNLSERAWAQGMAFNCFLCGAAPSTRDHDGVRHWTRSNGRFRRLVELPRTFGPRPTVQLYGVEGAPPPAELPFVADFGATSDAVCEPWLAIEARDGARVAATISHPGLFLFHNLEYSCIHAATGFGPLLPGQTAVAKNRVYLCAGSLEEWHERALSEPW